MKLQGFYKASKLFALFFFIFLFSSCDETKIYMKYHFFTRSEVEDVFINTDSVMHFQEELAKIETYDNFKKKQRIYSEADTLKFLSETGDTIKVRRVSSIEISDKSDGLAISPETYSSIGTAYYSLKDSDFFTGVTFGKSREAINKRDSIEIGFSYFLFNKVSLYANITNSSNGTDFSVTKEEYVNDNVRVADCYFISFYENNSIKAQMVYSSKHGFLQIKNNQHEINKIF